MKIFIEYDGAWVPLDRLNVDVSDEEQHQDDVLEDEKQWDS
jgi:hypothetical protein